jgi:hypothetical protein
MPHVAYVMLQNCSNLQLSLAQLFEIAAFALLARNLPLTSSMQTRLLIDGKFVQGAGADGVDAATGLQIAEAAAATDSQVDSAVAAAERFCRLVADPPRLRPMTRHWAGEASARRR